MSYAVFEFNWKAIHLRYSSPVLSDNKLSGPFSAREERQIWRFCLPSLRQGHECSSLTVYYMASSALAGSHLVANSSPRDQCPLSPISLFVYPCDQCLSVLAEYQLSSCCRRHLTSFLRRGATGRVRLSGDERKEGKSVNS